MYCTVEAMKLITDRYEASSGLIATAELLVISCARDVCQMFRLNIIMSRKNLYISSNRKLLYW